MKRTFIVAMCIASTLLHSCEGNSQSKLTQSTHSTSQTAFKNISQQEFVQLQSQPQTIVIDVRTPAEVAEGYIKGATVFADINGGNFEQVIAGLDKSKTYLVYCRSGKRSARASQEMVDAGFTQVNNLNGGIMDWTGAIEK